MNKLVQTALDKDFVVQKYLKVLTPQDAKMLLRWTTHADVPISDLKALSEKLQKVESVDKLTVYRGMGFNLSYQEKMGLFEKKFWMHFLRKEVKVGFKFKYATPRPLSFSDDLNTARGFGSTIVTTVLTRKNSYIRITQAMWEAINKIEPTTLFQETILLDINTDIEYTVFKT